METRTEVVTLDDDDEESLNEKKNVSDKKNPSVFNSQNNLCLRHYKDSRKKCSESHFENRSSIDISIFKSQVQIIVPTRVKKGLIEIQSPKKSKVPILIVLSDDEEEKPKEKKRKMKEKNSKGSEEKKMKTETETKTKTKNSDSDNSQINKSFSFLNDSFDSLIDECQLALKDKKDEFTKLKNKLGKYYSQIDFQNEVVLEKLPGFLFEKTSRISQHPDKLYLFIKDVLEELQKSQISKFEKCASDKVLQKLEKALKDCGEEIKKLEETEVNFSDDEDDSSYLLMHKYRKRYVEIAKKMSQIQNLKFSLHRKKDRKFIFDSSSYPEINRCISKFINHKKKNNLEFFPDYNDIVNIFEEVNTKQSLGLNKFTISHHAETAFIAIGKRLKAWRIHDDLDVLNSYVDESAIPILNETQSQQLKDNEDNSRKKLESIIEEFVLKQSTSRDTKTNESNNDDENEEENSEEEEDEDEGNDDDDDIRILNIDEKNEEIFTID